MSNCNCPSCYERRGWEAPRVTNADAARVEETRFQTKNLSDSELAELIADQRRSVESYRTRLGVAMASLDALLAVLDSRGAR